MEVYFSIITDVRDKSYITYKLSDILFIEVCAHICGMRDAEEIADFAEERWEFFKQYMDYERLPCALTFENILAEIDAKQLDLCLQGIFRNVLNIRINRKDTQTCIDGKTVCGVNGLHIVTAMMADYFAPVASLAVDSKTNEIPIVQELLDMINVEGSIISMDALHCQEETLAKIIDKKGDYVVQVKRNQESLYDDIEGLFKLGKIADKHMTMDKGHGRFEKRICTVLADEIVNQEYFSKWKGIQKIFKVERKTEKKGITTEEISYYISSKNATAEQLLSYTRKHWQIESFHWILDKVMHEDHSLIRDKNTQLCLNIIRKFAISIVKNYIETASPKKKTISGNMRKCLLNPEFLLAVLDIFCPDFYYIFVTFIFSP